MNIQHFFDPATAVKYLLGEASTPTMERMIRSLRALTSLRKARSMACAR